MGVVFFTTQVISPATLLSQTYEEVRVVWVIVFAGSVLLDIIVTASIKNKSYYS